MVFFYSVALILSLVLLYFLTWFWPPDSPWSFWWKTNKKTAAAIIKLADINKDDVVYELGSGDGEFMLFLGDKTDATGIGIEIDPYRFVLSKLRLLFHPHAKKHITFIKKNFYDVSYKDASVVYLYLVPRVIKELLPKLKKDLKKGARIVSFTYEVDLPLVKKDSDHKLFLYKI